MLKLRGTFKAMNPQQNLQNSPQTPTPPLTPTPNQPINQVNQTKRPSKFGQFIHNHTKVLAVLAVMLVGTAAAVVSFAATPNQSGKGGAYIYWWRYRYQETYWDGKVHANPIECALNQFICHANGTLVFDSGNKKAWQSDPTKNNTTNTLSSPTWYGPFTYSQGASWNDYGYSITGSQKVCYRVKDISGGTGSATIVVVVRNAPYSSYGINQPAKTILTLQGKLNASYKTDYQPLCISYYNPTDAYRQQDMLYVKSGKVQIDYVDRLVQAYYYNPYVYNYGSAALNGAVSQNTTTCSDNQSKTTDACLSKAALEAADASKNLTSIEANKATVAE